MPVDFVRSRTISSARKGEDAVDREALLKALPSFLKANKLNADWDGIENAPNEALVNALAMMSPYGAAEKQAMLEAPDLKTRAEILVALTEIELAKSENDGETSCSSVGRCGDGLTQTGRRAIVRRRTARSGTRHEHRPPALSTASCSRSWSVR